jgi:hypothetical protein
VNILTKYIGFTTKPMRELKKKNKAYVTYRTFDVVYRINNFEFLPSNVMEYLSSIFRPIKMSPSS